MHAKGWRMGERRACRFSQCSQSKSGGIPETQVTMAGWDCIHVARMELEDVMEAETIRARVAHLEPKGMHLRWHEDQATECSRLAIQTQD
jgi:hypothetical protein